MLTINSSAPSFLETRQPPRNLVSRDSHLFGPSMTERFPAWQLHQLNDVELFGRGPIRTSDGRYLVESFVNREHYDIWRGERGHWRAAAERMLQKSSCFDAPALWITDNWSCGYFHWFGDALPRLEIALREYPAEELTLLLPYKFRRHAYFLESLQPFGLKHVRTLDRFERLRCRQLLFPSHVAPTGCYDSDVMQSLQRTFRRHSRRHSSHLEESPVHERLYISRRLATRRRIANEEEILPVLADHGFQTLVAEETPWQRQLQLAANARFLVSNHGAGLTNLLMMAAGSRVMEIREQQDQHLNCYFNLASASAVDYYYLLARRSDPGTSVHFADLVVDPLELDRALRQMLGACTCSKSA